MSLTEFETLVITTLQRIAKGLENRPAAKPAAAAKKSAPAPDSSKKTVSGRIQTIATTSSDWVRVTVDLSPPISTKDPEMLEIIRNADAEGQNVTITYTEKPSPDGKYTNRYMSTVTVGDQLPDEPDAEPSPF